MPHDRVADIGGTDAVRLRDARPCLQAGTVMSPWIDATQSWIGGAYLARTSMSVASRTSAAVAGSRRRSLTSCPAAWMRA